MSKAMSVNEPERPAEGWKYPYVAGATDLGSNLKLSVVKASDRAVGYAIQPGIYFSSQDKPFLGFLDEFCAQHDLEPTLRETDTSHRIEISRREDLETFLRLIRPYVIARHDEVEILLKNLLPGLEMGKASSKEGFYQLMEYVDEIRELTRGSGAKYDQAHFRDEWNM